MGANKNLLTINLNTRSVARYRISSETKESSTLDKRTWLSEREKSAPSELGNYICDETTAKDLHLAIKQCVSCVPGRASDRQIRLNASVSFASVPEIRAGIVCDGSTRSIRLSLSRAIPLSNVQQ